MVSVAAGGPGGRRHRDERGRELGEGRGRGERRGEGEACRCGCRGCRGEERVVAGGGGGDGRRRGGGAGAGRPEVSGAPEVDGREGDAVAGPGALGRLGVKVAPWVEKRPEKNDFSFED